MVVSGTCPQKSILLLVLVLSAYFCVLGGAEGAPYLPTLAACALAAPWLSSALSPRTEAFPVVEGPFTFTTSMDFSNLNASVYGAIGEYSVLIDQHTLQPVVTPQTTRWYGFSVSCSHSSGSMINYGTAGSKVQVDILAAPPGVTDWTEYNIAYNQFPIRAPMYLR